MTDESENPNAPGWDAIDAAMSSLYGEQTPLHYGTLISWQLGGQDPLQGISVYRRDAPVPHWHFVTYGFSELYDKETDDPDTSGYGFELTFRLARDGDEEAPPAWALNFLQNLARYVFQSGNVFRAGHFMNLNGPIALERDTAIRSIIFVHDPELPQRDTPNGALEFLQVAGITLDEELAAKRWKTLEVAQVLAERWPLWITDLARTSLLDDAQVARRIEAGAKAEGSNTAFVHVDALSWQKHKRMFRGETIEITLGAKQAEEMRVLLPLRLDFGKAFALYGDDSSIEFRPAEAFAAHEEDGQLIVALPASCVADIAKELRPVAGSYAIASAPGLSFNIVKNEIRDRDGNVVEVFG